MHDGQTSQESLGAGSPYVGHDCADEMSASVAETPRLRLDFFAYRQADVRVTRQRP